MFYMDAAFTPQFYLHYHAGGVYAIWCRWNIQLIPLAWRKKAFNSNFVRQRNPIMPFKMWAWFLHLSCLYIGLVPNHLGRIYGANAKWAGGRGWENHLKHRRDYHLLYLI